MYKKINKKEDGLSILICTYNGEKRLPKTLNHLQKQENTNDIPWEVIVVDNASKDNTSEVAKEIWKNDNTPFKVISELKPGKTNAIIAGFKNAKFEIVCTVDDDNWVRPDYVSHIFNVMKNHPEVAICGGHGIGEFEETPPNWFEKIQNGFGLGQQGKTEGYVDGKGNPGYLYGACCAIRKSAWEHLFNNGFKFQLSGRTGKDLTAGDDYELGQAFCLIGYRLWYDPYVKFQHYMPASRINWKYTQRLFQAFGRNTLVIYIYGSELKIYSNRTNKIYSNYLMSLFYAFYKILRMFPSHFIGIFGNTEGNYKVLQFKTQWAYFTHLLANKRKFRKIKFDVRNAQWR